MEDIYHRLEMMPNLFQLILQSSLMLTVEISSKVQVEAGER